MAAINEITDPSGLLSILIATSGANAVVQEFVQSPTPIVDGTIVLKMKDGTTVEVDQFTDDWLAATTETYFDTPERFRDYYENLRSPSETQLLSISGNIQQSGFIDGESITKDEFSTVNNDFPDPPTSFNRGNGSLYDGLMSGVASGTSLSEIGISDEAIGTIGSQITWLGGLSPTQLRPWGSTLNYMAIPELVDAFNNLGGSGGAIEEVSSGINSTIESTIYTWESDASAGHGWLDLPQFWIADNRWGTNVTVSAGGAETIFFHFIADSSGTVIDIECDGGSRSPLPVFSEYFLAPVETDVAAMQIRLYRETGLLIRFLFVGVIGSFSETISETGSMYVRVDTDNFMAHSSVPITRSPLPPALPPASIDQESLADTTPILSWDIKINGIGKSHAYSSDVGD